jgi:hypothetical protein
MPLLLSPRLKINRYKRGGMVLSPNIPAPCFFELGGGIGRRAAKRDQAAANQGGIEGRRRLAWTNAWARGAAMSARIARTQHLRGAAHIGTGITARRASASRIARAHLAK